MREQLSNSGKTLKFMLLNYILKFVGGWINYSGKVINHKISIIGNRGSKSWNKQVKEQREYDSWLSKGSLRCSLLSNERYTQIKTLSNRSFKFNYSTISGNQKLHPWFITGQL